MDKEKIKNTSNVIDLIKNILGLVTFSMALYLLVKYGINVLPAIAL